MDSTSRDSGGGGGGAGRIRINAGTPVLLGVVSPALSTSLATTGPLPVSTMMVLIPPVDAGTATDAGATTDAGVSDAGAGEPDAGAATDAGTTTDAGAADGGVPSHGDYAVGCSCEAGPGVAALWVAALLWLVLRGRRRTS